MNRLLLTLSVFAMIFAGAGGKAQTPNCGTADLEDINHLRQCHINKLKWLDDETEALQARVDMIQNARSEIVAEYFDLGEDDVSNGGLALLRQAALRGIKVRVIIDALSSKVSNATLVALAMSSVKDGHTNLQIKRFNEFSFKNPGNLFGLTHRDHTKLLITDRSFVVAGGRNITCQYFYLCNNKTTFTDLDAIVAGPLAAEAQQTNFDILWNNTKAVTLLSYDARKAQTDSKVQQSLSHFTAAMINLKKGKVVQLKSAPDTMQTWIKKMSVLANARFLHDDPNQDPGTVHLGATPHQLIAPELFKVIGRATKTLTIETPYLYPDKDTQDLFKQLMAKGVHIKIITNSLHSTDNLPVQAGYRSVRDSLIKMGIELYEFKGPKTAHAKTAVIDGYIIVIGSFNLDPRSAELNREVAVVGESPELGQELTRIIEIKFQSNALLIGKNGHPIGNTDLWDRGVSQKKIDTVNGIQSLVLPLIDSEI